MAENKIFNAQSAAKVVNVVMQSDSRVQADVDELSAAITLDAVKRGRYPSEGEIYELVCGDSEGEIDDITVMWPATSSVISKTL